MANPYQLPSFLNSVICWLLKQYMEMKTVTQAKQKESGVLKKVFNFSVQAVVYLTPQFVKNGLNNTKEALKKTLVGGAVGAAAFSPGVAMVRLVVSDNNNNESLGERFVRYTGEAFETEKYYLKKGYNMAKGRVLGDASQNYVPRILNNEPQPC